MDAIKILPNSYKIILNSLHLEFPFKSLLEGV